MSAYDPHGQQVEQTAPRGYAPPPAKGPPIMPRIGRLIFRLIAIAVVVTGVTYLLEWARTEMTATDGWKADISPTGELKVLMPRKPEVGTFGEAATMRSAAEDWEVLLIESPADDDISMASLFGSSVNEDSIRAVSTSTFTMLGGKLEDSRTFRHRLGKHAIEFWGTYPGPQGVTRYLRELVVIAENGLVITLKVEGNATRDELVDFLYRNVEENVVFA